MRSSVTIFVKMVTIAAVGTALSACSTTHEYESESAAAGTGSQASMQASISEPSGAQTYESTQAEQSAQAQQGAQTGQAGVAANVPADQNQVVVPLYEERLQVGKRTVDAGQVRLKKVIRSETVNQPVQLRSETWVIDRVPASQQASVAAEPAGAAAGTNAPSASASGAPFQQKEIVLQVREEQPMVQTEIVHTGNIVAKKNVQSETQNVSRQVRREDIQLDKTGDTANVQISEDVQVANRPVNEAAGAQAPQQQQQQQPQESQQQSAQPQSEQQQDQTQDMQEQQQQQAPEQNQSSPQ